MLGKHNPGTFCKTLEPLIRHRHTLNISNIDPSCDSFSPFHMLVHIMKSKDLQEEVLLKYRSDEYPTKIFHDLQDVPVQCGPKQRSAK